MNKDVYCINLRLQLYVYLRFHVVAWCVQAAISFKEIWNRLLDVCMHLACMRVISIRVCRLNVSRCWRGIKFFPFSVFYDFSKSVAYIDAKFGINYSSLN